MTAIILPKHHKPKHYLLKCIFCSGGEVEFPVLLKTNVDIHQLACTDFKSFVLFTQEHLAQKISRGHGTNLIYEIFDTSTQNPKPETLNKLIDDAIQNMWESHTLKLQAGFLNISFDYEYPTTWSNFSIIKKSKYNDLKLLLDYSVEVIIGD